MSTEQSEFRSRVTLGTTGLQVARLGLASSYGIGAEALEEAYDRWGVNYFYWGSLRREAFGEGIRRLARRKREDLVVVIQSYARQGRWLAWSLERALRRLGLDRADILLLGYHNRPPNRRLMDAALRLRSQGRTRFLAVSCHHRPAFGRFIGDGLFDVLMFRYSAAHRGAEKDILPLLAAPERPGTVSYTATRWGRLLDPGRMPAGERTPRGSDCYRFVLSRPEIDVCLAGPKNAAEMREDLAALDRGPMDEAELGWMRRVGDHIHGGG